MDASRASSGSISRTIAQTAAIRAVKAAESALLRSAAIVKKWGNLTKLPGHEAYRTDLAKAADAILKKQGVDIYGKTYKPAVVHVTAGGK